MTISIFFDVHISDERRRARLQAGDIFVCSETQGTRDLIALARDLLETSFAPRDPRSVCSRCTGTTMRDYLPSTDLAHIPDDVLKLYDDGTEIEDRILYCGARLAPNSAS